MGFSRGEAAEQAKKDLAKRLDIPGGEVEVASISDKDYPDMSLGAPVNGA